MISARSRTELLDDVVAVLDRDLGVQSSSPITEDTRFFADLGLASIDAVVLSERLQEHYRRSLPFHELIADMGRRTERDLAIGELIAFLESKPLSAVHTFRPLGEISPCRNSRRTD